MIKRRALLRWGPLLGSGGLLGSALAMPVAARTLSTGTPVLAFQNLHTGERLRLDLPRDVAEWPQDALQALAQVLRDHRSGEAHPIDVQLLAQLQSLQDGVGFSSPFHVISGYRSPASNARLAAGSGGVARKSMHMQGRAIDIRVPGVNLVDLHRAALALKAGGVGLYRQSNFLHLDTGRVRTW